MQKVNITQIVVFEFGGSTKIRIRIRLHELLCLHYEIGNLGNFYRLLIFHYSSCPKIYRCKLLSYISVLVAFCCYYRNFCFYLHKLANFSALAGNFLTTSRNSLWYFRITLSAMHDSHKDFLYFPSNLLIQLLFTL